MQLLGHIIDEEVVNTHPEKIEAIQKIAIPRSVKEIRSFLEMSGYYRRFIFGFVGISAPLHASISKKRMLQCD